MFIFPEVYLTPHAPQYNNTAILFQRPLCVFTVPYLCILRAILHLCSLFYYHAYGIMSLLTVFLVANTIVIIIAYSKCINSLYEQRTCQLIGLKVFGLADFPIHWMNEGRSSRTKFAVTS